MTLRFDAGRLARIDKHFSQYVDDGRLAGWQLAVTRHDEVAHTALYGQRDKEAGLPVEEDTIWRIASMTKPLTSVAAMSLWEEGVFALTDPISKWIPSFANTRVYDKGPAAAPYSLPMLEEIKVWHLLSQTSGLTAGFMRNHVVDEMYRAKGFEFIMPEGGTLESVCEVYAGLPLLFQPGTAWGYGVSTDVLGRLVEIWTGQSLADAIASRITIPLGMTDTVWHADESRLDRLAALYVPSPVDGVATRMDALGDIWKKAPTVYSGGGGLLSTLADYVRFTRMLAGGGQLEGVRILAPRTLELMTANHLDGDLDKNSTGGFSETSLAGVGFGLGFATILDPVKQRNSSSAGEYYWGGAASTAFWVDPVEDITAVFMTQLLPSSQYPLRAELRQLVYSALV